VPGNGTARARRSAGDASIFVTSYAIPAAAMPSR
jgi:hypothetical protein